MLLIRKQKLFLCCWEKVWGDRLMVSDEKEQLRLQLRKFPLNSTREIRTLTILPIIMLLWCFSFITKPDAPKTTYSYKISFIISSRTTKKIPSATEKMRKQVLQFTSWTEVKFTIFYFCSKNCQSEILSAGLRATFIASRRIQQLYGLFVDKCYDNRN